MMSVSTRRALGLALFACAASSAFAPSIAHAQGAALEEPPPPSADAEGAPAPLSPLPPSGEAPKGMVDEDDTGALSGVELGLRSGIALPMGNAFNVASTGASFALSDIVSNHIPIVIDVGYRVVPSVTLGVYGQYGILNPKCTPATTSCSGSDVRVGAQVHWRPVMTGSVIPWLGAGVGFEWLSASASSASSNDDISLSGIELLNLQGGVEFQAASAFTIGPFVAFSLSQFSSASENGASGSIQDTSMHEWLTLGLRGAVQ